MNWIEQETKISDVESLLLNGYDVEVDSPDGFVPVSLFVDKGMWDEYVMTTSVGDIVRCNENHLFETDNGWVYAKDCISKKIRVLSRLGFVDAIIVKTEKQIPIVDIQVDHENHRYYTNGVSSHNTGVGKSAFMCHHAACCLMQNKNVLYITLEMAEERIAQRIDANIMDISMDELHDLPLAMYTKRLQSCTRGVSGKLIIKEYPTSAAGANHFSILLDELKLKRGFLPDIIFVDYINICSSSRLKTGGNNVNSYSYIKAIAEELRGLAMERNVPVITATQTNRGGYDNSDLGLTDTAESFGLPATADFMVALISTEDLEKAGQIMVKQLKNRYNTKVANKKFIVGLNYSKMKFYDVKKEEFDELTDSETTKEEGFGRGYSKGDFKSKFAGKGRGRDTSDWKV